MVKYKGWGKDFDKTPMPWKILAVTVFAIVMIVLVTRMLSIVLGYSPAIFGQGSTE